MLDTNTTMLASSVRAGLTSVVSVNFPHVRYYLKIITAVEAAHAGVHNVWTQLHWPKATHIGIFLEAGLSMLTFTRLSNALPPSRLGHRCQ